MNFLEVENLTKYFEKGKKKIVALDNVSFKVEEGEIVGLLGPNGSGKTTLLNLILGFYIPDKGDIKIYGESIFKKPELIRKYVRIPFLLEDPRFTVWEVLKLTAKLFGVKDYKEKIEYWLKFFEIEHERNTQIQKLSTGNYKKVKIIGALLSSPKLLLLDEITNGLDLISVNRLIDILKKLNQEHNVSIIFASHIFQHVEKLCKRILIIYKGKILADDTVENLKKKAGLKEYVTIETEYPIPNELFLEMKKKFNIIQVKENEYKIVTDDAGKEIKRLASFLAKNQQISEIIKSIKVKELSLEDIFAYFISEAETSKL